jgi:hypothetical protein
MSKKKTLSKQGSIYQSLGRTHEDATFIKQLKAARTDFGVLTQTPYIVEQPLSANNSGDASIETHNIDHTKISGEESESSDEVPFTPHTLCFPL